jgi:ribosomal protein L37AE/L43A
MKKDKTRCMCCDRWTVKTRKIALDDKTAIVYVCPKCAKDHPKRVAAQDWCSDD